MRRDGQIQIGFNWIFVLIAGAVILLFFAGIIVKQKSVAESQLNQEVVSLLDSIFVAAQAADKTTTVLPLRGLETEVLEFDCEEGVSYFSIEGSGFREENAVDPLFAPAEVRGDRLFLMSLPYDFPYKVADFLMITDPNHRYVVVGTFTPFVEEFLNQTEGFTVDYAIDSFEGVTVAKEDTVRVVDTDGGFVVNGGSVPGVFSSLEDGRVSAVSFTPSNVRYYQKKGNTWSLLGESPLLLSGGKRDAAKYAAIFAENDAVYWCGMEKMLKRMGFVSQVYVGKAKEMVTFYDTEEEFLCKSDASLIEDAVRKQQGLASVCTATSCNGLLEQVDAIKEKNTLLRECGVQLY